MNAAELDRYLAAERAYREAVEGGATHDAALDAARAAIAAKAREQVLERVGALGR